MKTHNKLNHLGSWWRTVALALASLPLVASAQDEIAPGIIDLDESDFIVTSQADIQSMSLEKYRQSDAITNVISADEMGQFVDQNVAESLHRLPGTSITRDQGEGRFVSIRGIEPALNSTSINGMRIGTPEDGNRNIPLDIIPSGTAQILEVTKVPTPDMPGDSIGGAIDISTSSAFDRKGRSITYKAEGSYSELTEEMGPKLKFGYSDLLSVLGGEDNFGISFGIKYQDRDFGSDNIETEYDDNLGDVGVFGPAETQLRQYIINRERLGLSLDLDFSPSDGNEFFLKTVFTQFTDAETRQRSIFRWNEEDSYYDPGSSDPGSGTYEFTGIDDGDIRRRIRFRTQEQEVLALSTGGRHELDNWNIDYLIGFSEATEDSPDEIEGRFRYDGPDTDATVNAGSGIPTFTINTGGDDYLRNENFELKRVVLEEKYTEETTQNLAANFERLADGDSLLPKLKFGFDARFTQKDVDIEERELSDVPGAAPDLDAFNSGRRSFPFHSLGDGISSSAFKNYFYANRADFGEEDDKETASNRITSEAPDFEADEDVYAGYFMGTWDWTDWRLIAGARVERTDFSSEGNLLELNADEETFARDEKIKASSKYTDFLPGVHLRYEGFDNIVIRGAWSNTIGRPNFDALAPNQFVNRDKDEAEVGNPDLEPYESSNLDLMFDYYLPGAGIFSAGVFYKKIDNYIVEIENDNYAPYAGTPFQDYDVTRSINGDDAHVYGLELNYEQQLGEWTGVLEGFLIGANATFLDTEFETEERAGETFQLPRASEEVFNFYLGYERGRLSTRLSSNWRSEFLEELGGSKELDIYVADHNQWDLTFAYRILPELELIAEVSNITDEPLELYQGSEGNNFQFEEYGRTFGFGIKGKF
jgi:TonB-dependent receptor